MQPAHTDQPRPDPDPAQGYERSGVNLRAVMKFLIIFVAFGIVVHFLLYFLYKGLVVLDRRRDVAPTALMSQRPEDTNRFAQVFPAPQLQPSPGHTAQPFQDMRHLLDAENQEFARRGWSVDPVTNEPQMPQALVDKILATTQPSK